MEISESKLASRDLVEILVEIAITDAQLGRSFSFALLLFELLSSQLRAEYITRSLGSKKNLSLPIASSKLLPIFWPIIEFRSILWPRYHYRSLLVYRVVVQLLLLSKEFRIILYRDETLKFLTDGRRFLPQVGHRLLLRCPHSPTDPHSLHSSHLQSGRQWAIRNRSEGRKVQGEKC